MAETVCSALLGPSCGNIDSIEGNGVNTGQRSAAVMDGVGLKESRFFLVPLIGFDGDMVSKEQARLCGAAALAAVKMAGRLKDAIDGGCRDSGKLLEKLFRESFEFDLVGIDPEREDGFEALPAGQMSGDPDLVEDSEEFRRAVGRFTTRFFSGLRRFRVSEVLEGADSIFAVVVTNSA